MDNFSVQSLLNGDLPSDYRDKVFWYAEKVTQIDSVINIYIYNDNLVTFDSYAKELNIRPISQFTSASQEILWNLGEKQILVSSGTFLWVNNKLLLTQRTANTKYAPLAWTTPAGRCDDTPLRTGLKETIEEIHIRSMHTDKLWMPEIAKELISNVDEVLLYDATIDFPVIANNKLTKVKTWLENELIEEAMLWYFYDKKANTLEFRLPLQTFIDDKLVYSNPEFHTDVQALELNDLKKMKVVPAVAKLIDSI